MNVQLKLPVPPDVQADATGLPAKVKLIAEDAAKPFPVASTPVPTGPNIGVRARLVFTENVADAALEAASVATTVLSPFGAAGTENTQLKLPVPTDVQADGAETPLSLKLIADVAAKPVPDAVTGVPTGPKVGDRVRLAVTENGAEAELLEASVAATVSAPFGASGTVNVQVKVPVANKVHDAGITAAINLMVIGGVGAKPFPVAVTTVPTGPLVGERVRLAVTVNSALAVMCPASSTSVNSGPFGAGGTVNVQVKDPEASVAQGEGVVGTEPPLKVNASKLPDGLKPVPIALTTVPTGPLAGESVRLAVTEKPAVGELVPSVATTVLPPFVASGTVKVHGSPVVPGKAPVASVAQVEATAPPANVKLIPVDASMPVPEAVTTVPTLPLVGERLRQAVHTSGAIAGEALESTAVEPNDDMAVFGPLDGVTGATASAGAASEKARSINAATRITVNAAHLPFMIPTLPRRLVSVSFIRATYAGRV